MQPWLAPMTFWQQGTLHQDCLFPVDMALAESVQWTVQHMCKDTCCRLPCCRELSVQQLGALHRKRQHLQRLRSLQMFRYSHGPDMGSSSRGSSNLVRCSDSH